MLILHGYIRLIIFGLGLSDSDSDSRISDRIGAVFSDSDSDRIGAVSSDSDSDRIGRHFSDSDSDRIGPVVSDSDSDLDFDFSRSDRIGELRRIQRPALV